MVIYVTEEVMCNMRTLPEDADTIFLYFHFLLTSEVVLAFDSSIHHNYVSIYDGCFFSVQTFSSALETSF